MSNAAGLVLISSFNNEHLLAHTGTCQKGKVNPLQILSCLLLLLAYGSRSPVNMQSQLHIWWKATQPWTALGSEQLIFQAFVTERQLQKSGKKPLSLMRFPSLCYPQGLQCLAVRAQGTSSARAHFIKCRFRPNFTLWPTLPAQRKRDARCSPRLLPLQHFIHYSKKNLQAPIQNQVPPAWALLSQDKVLACLQLAWCLTIISQPSLLLQLFPFFPSLLEFEL